MSTAEVADIKRYIEKWKCIQETTIPLINDIVNIGFKIRYADDKHLWSPQILDFDQVVECYQEKLYRQMNKKMNDLFKEINKFEPLIQQMLQSCIQASKKSSHTASLSSPSLSTPSEDSRKMIQDSLRALWSQRVKEYSKELENKQALMNSISTIKSKEEATFILSSWMQEAFLSRDFEDNLMDLFSLMQQLSV